MSHPATASASNELREVAQYRRVRSASWWTRFWRHRLALAGVVALGLLVTVAVVGPLVYPHHPDQISYNFQAPASRGHPLGTDDVGRDILAWLMYASRISLSVGISVAILSAAIGTAIGSLAGYFGGRVDTLLSGLINVMLSIPLIPLAMVLGAFLGTSLSFLILILGLTTWNGTARIIRAECLDLREREYVVGARVIGANDNRIIVRHILPNVMSLVIVATTLQVASAILAESALSFLGYGIQPPEASWGNMLQNAQRYFRTNPALAIYPGVLISLTVICVNFVGDGLRDALDPRLRR
jgi:peptide/nickel transport system permease protein